MTVPGSRREDMLREALRFRLRQVESLRAGHGEIVAQVQPDAAATPSEDVEELMRQIMVRALPRAAAGEREALALAVEHLPRLPANVADPWLRVLDVWNNVFEAARRHPGTLESDQLQRLLSRYAERLLNALDSLGGRRGR